MASFIDKFNKTYGKAQDILGQAENIGDLLGIDVAGALGINSGRNRVAERGFDVGGQKARIETTGIFRSNLFLTTINPPSLITSLSNFSKLDNPVFLCHRTELPGMNFMTEEIMRTGYGPIEKIPYKPAFNDLTMEFIVDGDGEIKSFFEKWTNNIIPYNNFQTPYDSVGIGTSSPPYLLNFRDEYSTEIGISIFNPSGDEIGFVMLYGAYPISIIPITLDWSPNNSLTGLIVNMSYINYVYMSSLSDYNKLDQNSEIRSIFETIRKGTSIVQTLGNIKKPKNLRDVTNIINNTKTILRGL